MPFESVGGKLTLAPLSELFIKLKVFEMLGFRFGVDMPELA